MTELSRGNRVLVHGAGAIGLYLGARLARAGVPVHFVGRPPVIEAIRQRGLQVQDVAGGIQHLEAARFGTSTSPADAPAPTLVLLTVKGPATRDSAAELQACLAAGTPVLSFQNGIDNAERLRTAAPALQAISGMVPFNVVQPEPGRLQQTTSGRLAAQDCAVCRLWQPMFTAAGLPLDLRADMQAVLWGKLLLNLNNPLNALAGVPLLEQLGDRGYRRLLAILQDEALVALRAAGIHPARATPLPSRWLPTLLRLPNPLFRALARRMLTIRPDARLSMYFDRVQGRPTEVDDLCGAVVRLAAAHGHPAPANQAVQRLLESTPAGRFFSAGELGAAIRGEA